MSGTGQSNLPVKDPGHICNARKPDDTYCQNPAGLMTAHPGYGRCYIHGGRTPVRYSLARIPAPPHLQEAAAEYLQDTQVFDLRREIAVLKATMERIDLSMEDEDSRRKDAATLAKLADSIGRLTHSMHVIEMQRKYLVHVYDVQRMLEKIAAIIQDTIDDPELRKKIAKEITLQLQGSDIIGASWHSLE